jgi:predicted CopG family antitoxin
MTFDTENNFVRSRLYGLFLLGIVMLGFAIYQLQTIWTSKSSLVSLKGTLKYCDIYIRTVSSRSRYGYEAKSQKSELILYLNEHRKKFALVENIGSDFRNENYEKIKTKLRRAEEVTVWVKAVEINDWEPQIFQIRTNRKEVLDYQTIRFKERPLTAFLMLMGFGCIGFPLYAFCPHWFNRQHKHPKRLPTTSALQKQG